MVVILLSMLARTSGQSGAGVMPLLLTVRQEIVFFIFRVLRRSLQATGNIQTIREKCMNRFIIIIINFSEI